MNSDFEIAKIVKPRGLKGEMKIQFYTSNVSRLLRLKKVTLLGTEYGVEKIVAEGEYGYIKIKGVDDADAVEKLRNVGLYASREDLPPLEKGKHYIIDIVGLKVIVGANEIGVISDVLQYGSADVYVVRTNDGSLSFPALKQLIKKVDIEGGVMVLDDVIFSRVVVYN